MPSGQSVRYRRLLLKLSGEALMGDETFGISSAVLAGLADEIAETRALGVELAVVVGGFGSSNTRHLYELARGRAAAWFIEDAEAIRPGGEILAMDPHGNAPAVMTGWLPDRRPLRVGVLAGASSPDVVVGGVLEVLAALLS